MGDARSTKMKIMRLLLLPLFFILIHSVQAQKFSTEKEKFLKQLPKAIENESFTHFIKKDFTGFLNTSKLGSQEYRKSVV